ncbi:MAG: uracil-DNA glycosylase [Proteobacteria bacterium]|nr:uracil-DNA glycosylase [Pseudomonadota bacterium]
MNRIDLPFVDYQYPAGKGPPGLFMLVGEAPGKDEVKQGMPFVGRSGKLLDKNLQEAGLERGQCLVANVFRYQPPGNKVGHFFLSNRAAEAVGEKLAVEFGKFGGKSVRALFAAELEYLKKTIAEKKPKVIVTLGATPLWALTGLGGIVALRGKLQECRFVPGIPVIPTFHPSYILRGNWAAEPLFQKDLAESRKILMA